MTQVDLSRVLAELECDSSRGGVVGTSGSPERDSEIEWILHAVDISGDPRLIMDPANDHYLSLPDAVTTQEASDMADNFYKYGPF